MSKMIPISVKVPAELLARADIAASRFKVSRGEIIGSALQYFLDNIEKRERDRARLNSKNQEYETMNGTMINGTMCEKWIYIQI